MELNILELPLSTICALVFVSIRNKFLPTEVKIHGQKFAQPGVPAISPRANIIKMCLIWPPADSPD